MVPSKTHLDFVLLFSAAFLVWTPVSCDNTTSSEDCTEALQCSQCIRIPNCSWCADPGRLSKYHPLYDSPRCRSNAQLTSDKCPSDFILDRPKNHVNYGDSQEEEFSPTQLLVEAPVGETVDVLIKYIDPKDKPLDLYILLDNSYTMRLVKETVVNQSDALVIALNVTSSKVQLGYGSYVDKPLDPFSRPENVEGLNTYLNGTEFEVKDIEPVHLFKHIVSMTNDTALFRDTTKGTNSTSANKDDPEGGLDALVQVITCREEIGWRNDTTRLIVVATDGPMQTAGYGRLAGIVRPNDLKCHSGDYAALVQQDFPSLNQVHRLIVQEEVNVIFAVTELMIPFYKKIQSRIPRITVVKIDSKGTELVNHTKNIYESIRSTVAIGIEPFGGLSSEDYNITYHVNCTEAIDSGKYGDTCSNVTFMHPLFYQFKLTLNPSICGKNTEDTHLKIKREGSSSFVKLEIRPACDCQCEVEDKSEEKTTSASCNGKGNEVCGACKCFPTHEGKTCKCDKSKSKGDPEAEAQCFQGGLKCSERGECECGSCVCNDAVRYQGPFCEFDQFDCINSNGTEPCSGHGECFEAKCICDRQWTGRFCDCNSSTANCKEPGSDKVCSDGGTCACQGTTSVDQTKSCIECESGRSGRYCEYCTSGADCEAQMQQPKPCTDPAIRNLISCYYTSLKKSGDPNQGSILKSCTVNHGKSQWFPMIKTSPQSPTDQDLQTYPCVYNEGRCTIHYDYAYSEDGTELLIFLGHQECPIQLFWIIIGVSGAIIVIGMITLIVWKVLTSWWDRKDYEQFQQEINGAKWSQVNNPLYDTPLTNVENPVFRRSAFRPTSWLPKRLSRLD